MKIAQIAPLSSSVPPKAYGGTELIVHMLTEALVRRGHEVTLFSSGDSITSAKLVPGSKCELKDSGISVRTKHILSMENVLNCLQRAGEFDIIHNHSFPEGLAMAGLSGTPTLTTFHENLNGIEGLFLRYRGWYNTVSHSQKTHFPDKEGYAGTVYNAVACDSFPFSNNGDREDYLLFLASLLPHKGAHIAIEVAQRLQRKLVIAGNINEEFPDYFRDEIEPKIDGKLIHYFGEANQAQKRELLVRADCLLAPIDWEEPFGLQFIEAMVCGTPPVAFNRGAVPEVINHGKTGFVVDTIEAMVAAVKNISWIDRTVCRQHVEQNFDAPIMVQNYLDVYEYIFERK